jgi:hypothetical protein
MIAIIPKRLRIVDLRVMDMGIPYKGDSETITLFCSEGQAQTGACRILLLPLKRSHCKIAEVEEEISEAQVGRR